MEKPDINLFALLQCKSMLLNNILDIPWPSIFVLPPRCVNATLEVLYETDFFIMLNNQVAKPLFIAAVYRYLEACYFRQFNKKAHNMNAFFMVWAHLPGSMHATFNLCSINLYDFFVMINEDIYPLNWTSPENSIRKLILFSYFTKLHYKMHRITGCVQRLIPELICRMQKEGNPTEEWNKLAFVFLQDAGITSTDSYTNDIVEQAARHTKAPDESSCC